MQAIEHAVAATRGARDYQEDAARFWSSTADDAVAVTPCAQSLIGLAVLADGMGGHVGGAMASQTVCDTFLAAAIAAVPERADPAQNAAADPVKEDIPLMRALLAANAALAEKISENPLLNGMGSTMVGVAFESAGLRWVSVGDSPLFLFRHGELVVLNEDHSMAPELDRLVAAGQLTEDEARHDRRRHMLRSAVTGDDIDMVDLSKNPLVLEPDDYVILASDGIATLDESEMTRIIKGYAADGARAVAAALIRAVDAVREPFQDNTTVIVVRQLPA